MERIYLGQDGEETDRGEHGNKRRGSIKYEEFLDYPRNTSFSTKTLLYELCD
jgi:hypothetical protein